MAKIQRPEIGSGSPGRSGELIGDSGAGVADGRGRLSNEPSDVVYEGREGHPDCGSGKSTAKGYPKEVD
jgi:hypothetical protein